MANTADDFVGKLDELMMMFSELEDGMVVCDTHNGFSGLTIFDGFMCWTESDKVCFSDINEQNKFINIYEIVEDSWYIDDMTDNIIVELKNNQVLEFYRL